MTPPVKPQPTPQPAPQSNIGRLAGLLALIERSNKAGVITVQIVYAHGRVIGWRNVDGGELHGYGRDTV